MKKSAVKAVILSFSAFMVLSCASTSGNAGSTDAGRDRSPEAVDSHAQPAATDQTEAAGTTAAPGKSATADKPEDRPLEASQAPAADSAEGVPATEESREGHSEADGAAESGDRDTASSTPESQDAGAIDESALEAVPQEEAVIIEESEPEAEGSEQWVVTDEP